MYKKFKNNKILKNASWLIAGKCINRIIAFLVSLLTARYLGPNNYGLINYATAYTTFFASLCNLGINSIIVKNFVDHPKEEGETIGTTLVLKVISSLLSVGIIIGIVSIVDRKEPLTIIVVMLVCLGIIFQVFDTLNYWFQVRLQSKYSALVTTIAYAVVSFYKVILMITGKDVRWFAISTSVDYIVIAVLLVLAYKKQNGPKFSFSLKKAKELLKDSNSFIISGLMVSIYACTDKLMLKQMLDENSVGYYSLAVSICSMWTFILSAIIDSLYPSIMQLNNCNRKKYEKRNRQLYAIVFYLSIIVSAGICIVAKPMIFILYGKEYLPTVMPLRIIVWYTAFSYLGVARNAWIVCEKKQKYLKYLYIGAAILNVFLNMILIPHYGTVGASVASLVTEIATVLIIPSLIKELRPNTKMMLDAIMLKNVWDRES